MEDVIRSRPTLFFLIVLALLFLVMSRSSQTRYVGETRTMFERTVMTIFSPVPKSVNWVGRSTSDMYHGYLDMRRAVNENNDLRHKVSELTAKNLRLQQSEGDVRRLRTLLGYSEQVDMPTTLATAIMLDTSGRFKSLIIDRGSDAGVEVNDAVVNSGGLIGRVVLTTKDMSKIQLITDSNCAVGTLIDRTRRQGVVRGDGRGNAQMSEVPSLADVIPGDTATTAGIDGIFPKGIPVGTITKVTKGTDLFKTIAVKPAVDFGAIEEVIVIHTRKIPPQVARYTP